MLGKMNGLLMNRDGCGGIPFGGINGMLPGLETAFNPRKNELVFVPKRLNAARIDESMDCLSLADKINLDVSAHGFSTLFCHILMTKFIARLFFAVLYNRNFADHRLFAAEAAKNLT